MKNSDIKAREGGDTFLSKYDNSLHKALSSLYPDHDWLPWAFESVPRGFWDILENQKKFLDWFAKEAGITKMEQWYTIQVNSACTVPVMCACAKSPCECVLVRVCVVVCVKK